MTKTLTAFQREWYQLLQRGVVDQNKLDNLPDCYAQNEELQNRVKFYEKEMNAIKAAVSIYLAFSIKILKTLFNNMLQFLLDITTVLLSSVVSFFVKKFTHIL